MVNLNENTAYQDREPVESSFIIWIAFGALVIFILWAVSFELERFVRAQGQVISSSRVQLIQTVDGGVLSELNVREGDQVLPGQILARIDSTRFAAQTNEVLARVNALKAKVARLRAEVSSAPLIFPAELAKHTDITSMERTLYERRLKRLREDSVAHMNFLEIAKKQQEMVDKLHTTGDVDKSEMLNAKRSVIEAQAKIDTIRNEYYETAGQELTRAEDELAQSLQVFSQRNDLLQNSTLRAMVPGIVKNISITTIGAVTRPGEELMQIVPSQDTLIIEAKVAPVDIGDLREGLSANVKIDAFDSSVYGSLEGKVTHISADTVASADKRGTEQKHYIVHITLPQGQLTTSIGKAIDIIPGMTSQVDIKTGKRTVMDYILKPIVKTLSQSLGEK
jgi:adhesin transport system membrane fusion protein